MVGRIFLFKGNCADGKCIGAKKILGNIFLAKHSFFITVVAVVVTIPQFALSLEIIPGYAPYAIFHMI